MATPEIYAKDFLARRDMIWKGLSAVANKNLKDPVAYLNRTQKKYGALVKEAAGLAYEHLPNNCYAVCEDKIDEALSAKYGWQTVQGWRNESFKQLREDMKE